MLEMKAEVKSEDTEPDASEPKGEPGSAMMEEDLPGSSQVKEESDTTEQKSEPMEVDEKKPEVKAEAKEEEESTANGAASQSASPSQPRKKSRLCFLDLTELCCFPIVLWFHTVNYKLKQKQNFISPFIFLACHSPSRSGG